MHRRTLASVGFVLLACFAGSALGQGTQAAVAPQHQTLIHVLGPDGKPVPRAVLTLQKSTPGSRPAYSIQMADDDGIFHWEHAPFDGKYQLSIGSQADDLADVAQATIRLSFDEMRQVKIGGQLAGQLLLADGKPARGWFVGQVGGEGSFSAGHTPSVTLEYGPEGLLPVDAAGNFRLAMMSETLMAVSPEGVPLLYQVNPANWPREGQHFVITLPKTRTVQRGTVVNADGTPAAGALVHAGMFFTEANNAFMSLGDFGFMQPETPPHTAPPPAAVADASGQFAIPVPWGTYITPGSADTAFTFERSGDDRFVRKPVPPRQPWNGGSPLDLSTISGRVLAPDGTPVVGASVEACTRSTLNGSPTWSWGGTPVRTDVQGRFTLTNVPSGVSLQVSAEMSAETSLPGWSEPVPVAAGSPGIDIQLKPGGAIRILLPESLEHPISMAALETTARTNGDVNKQVLLTYDSAEKALVARSAAPGEYTLNPRSAPELAGTLTQPVKVQVGAEARIDLRNQILPPSARGALRWVNLKVLEKGQPAGGIQVGVYTERFSPELVQDWLQQWQSGDENSRAALLPKLQAAAGAALDRLQTLKPEARDAFRAKLPQGFGFWEQPDDFQKVAVDLTNDQGLVRFEGQVGREYAVCAIAPGRGIALQRFTLAADDPSLTLQPTRSLVYHVPAGKMPPPPEEVSAGRGDMVFHILEPAGMTQRAWMSLLSEGRMGFARPDLNLRGNGTDEQFDDLPVGAAVEVYSIQKYPPTMRSIKIEPGEGPVIIP